jgi:integrase
MLTELKIRGAKPAAKPYRLYDRAGLYLQVTMAGSRLWRLKYRLVGREKLLALGAYPAVSLLEARELQAEAKRAIRHGRDPSAERRAMRQKATALAPVQSFEAVARDWHSRQAPRWTPSHAGEVLHTLEVHVFPTLGRLHINDITPPMVLSTLRQIEAGGAVASAHRVRGRMSKVFVYALACGIGQGDPAGVVKGALSPVVRGRQPAIIERDRLREMLRKVEAEPAHPVTKLGLRFLAISVARSFEVRGAKWDELEDFEGEAPLWRIPRSRTKTREEHIVPLSPEAVAVIRAVKPFSGRSPYIFPNVRHPFEPLSEGAIGALLNRAGYRNRHCPHGFRASFSTIMNERHPQDRDAIEKALGHKIAGAVRAAYMRSSFLDRRRELLAEWAGLLLAGAVDAEALVMGRRR